jgi:peptidyl-prolyl cis-trans isomerase SurA
MTKTVFTLLTVAALVVPMRAAQSREIIEQVLVKVNGDIITKTDLERRQIEEIRRRLGSQVDEKALQNDAELKKVLLEITPKILVDAIDEMIVVQVGRDKGYRFTDDMFQRWLAELRKEQNLEDDAKFQQALKQEGMTLADLRRQVERGFIIQQVQRDEVGSKLTITEEEARQYYLQHREEFVEPASVTLREITVDVPTTTQGGQAGVSVGAVDPGSPRACAGR